MNRPATPAVQHGNGLHRHGAGEVGGEDWGAWTRWNEADGLSNPIPQGEPDAAGYDTLADLFLGEAAAALPFDAPQTMAPSRHEAELPLRGSLCAAPADVVEHAPPVSPLAHPTVELLILGHLPVLASAWASQYARHAAEVRGGPVGVLRLDHGAVVVEVVGAEPRAAVLTDDARRVPFVDAIACATALTAVSGGSDADTPHPPVWVLRAGPLDEPGLIDRACVRVVTVLTGADEAALVGAYRTVKSIVQRLQRREEAGQAADLRIVLMGAPEGKAGPAAAKLAEAVRTFLGRTVVVEIGPERIGSSHPPLLLFERPAEPDANAAVGAFERAVVHAHAALRARGESWDTKALPPLPAGEGGRGSARPGGGTLRETHAQRPLRPSPSLGPPPPLGAGEGPLPQACRESTASTLARFIAGLTPLHVRCPYARSVEVAIDRAGTIHLLASEVPDDARDGERSTPGAEAPALGLLLSAAAWANVHAPLIRSTLGTDSPAPHIPPVPHLFVAHPSTARRLLETDVRLHLLAHVEVEGKPGWYSTELN